MKLLRNFTLIPLFLLFLISCEEEVLPVTFTLTTQVTPAGSGTVSPPSGTFDEGASITISATPSANYIFKQWTGTGSGTANPLTFQIISNSNITAEFSLIDADNDGVTDALDNCPDTPTGITVNSQGCATSQLDTDEDGVSDDQDKCPNTPVDEDIDENGCSISQIDSDGDGVTDDKDQCPDTPSGSSVDSDGCEVSNVFERLQGNTYKQVESVSDCGTCEDEINYYTFSENGLQISGTTLEGVCEQNDFQEIGDCNDCATITENTPERMTVCVGNFIQLCQTITFLSDDEIQFDFPVFDQKWTAQKFEDEVPCTNWSPPLEPFFSGVFAGAIWNNGVFEFPSSADAWAGFANNTTSIYPIELPDGGKITFTASTEGTDIDVQFRFEFNPHPNVDPAYDSEIITVSGTSAKEYSVDIPSQGENTYSSLIFYLKTRDQKLTASDFKIIKN
jgi:hypothetical protein